MTYDELYPKVLQLVRHNGYIVCFGQDVKGGVLAGWVMSAKTIEDAKALRYASGDLVFSAQTRKIVHDRSWLWDWEKGQENCYAQRAIAEDWELKTDLP